mmetsp:Transcript_43314/g.41720  ORF Transcript_43314/g.41720 Transcript_43314/m.41720 type:complete len:155 (+) Transcript_43314:442-906(+)|eukprot:CAMPEP_0170549930 /NCGR_PEP_ID=MMETSP0211-20121228/8016_1 /TAXON_ID=311385 /ORGANISM="Pseudokeronopsis sp., Strain OXSARD2" /LENGTH=154 /DNA_ID=CAMNT_0010856181 /DNA_START=396 /DNA_END=860 /DNA_ORIENTATION=+
MPVEHIQTLPGTIVDYQNKYTDLIFQMLKCNEVRQLNEMLATHQEEIQLLEMRDSKDFTVLSFAAYKNQEEAFINMFNHALEFNLGLLTHFKTFEQKKDYLTRWVNYPTDEGFTAIHFATYHGNFPLIKFLIETAGADVNKKNKFGSTVMHVAA